MADINARAKMTADLLKKQNLFKGQTVREIKNALGNPDGFYFTDIYPAYLIDMTTDDSWQIVFLLDKEHKVSELIVHKNCCDK